MAWTAEMDRMIQEASKYCRRTHTEHPLTTWDREHGGGGLKQMDREIYDIDAYCAEAPCECLDLDQACTCTKPEEQGDDNEG